MLSDRERQELAAIERLLTAGDRRLAAALRSGWPIRERRWPSWALLGFGAFVLVTGVVTGADMLFVQGLFFLFAGLVWRHWRTLSGRPVHPPIDSSRRTRPGGSPPGW